jgi:hypothetical protein
MINRAEFYQLPLLCEEGHEHYEPLARRVSREPINCSRCGKRIPVTNETRDEVHKIIDDFNRLPPRST